MDNGHRGGRDCRMILVSSDVRVLAGVAVLLGWSAASVHAQVFETVGARALGMGGAFVAVADDATANYWNPAGLSKVSFSGLVDVQRTETRFGADPTRRQGASHHTSFVSFGTNSFGLTYYRIQMRQVRREGAVEPGGDGVAPLASLVTQHFGMTAVQPLGPGVVIATVLKAVRGTAAVGVGGSVAPIGELFDQASALHGDVQTRFDMDAGLLVGSERLRLGLVGRNLREPEFLTPGGELFRLGRQWRAGLSFAASQSLRFAIDSDLTTIVDATGHRRMVALGVEQRFARLVVRGGGRINVQAPDIEPIGALGFSLEVTSGFWLDGQVTGGRDDGDHGWGVSTRVGF